MDMMVRIVNEVCYYELIVSVLISTSFLIFIAVTFAINPKITEYPKNTSGKLYSSVNLTCRVEGVPTPTIQWYKNNVTFSNENKDPSVLLFQELNLDDRGFYHCEAHSWISGQIISVKSPEVILNIAGITDVSCSFIYTVILSIFFICM